MGVITCWRGGGGGGGRAEADHVLVVVRGEGGAHSHFLRCANTSWRAQEVLLSWRRKWRIWLVLAMAPAVMTTLQGHSME